MKACVAPSLAHHGSSLTRFRQTSRTWRALRVQSAGTVVCGGGKDVIGVEAGPVVAASPRRLAVLAVGCASLLALQQPVRAEELRTAYFAGGNFSFLEKQFSDLKYAGVKEAIPGFAETDRIEAVKVNYDADRISFEQLVRTFWKYVNPTQTDGQFSEKGPQYTTAVWVSNEREKAFVLECMAKLERSGIFGNRPLVTKVLDAPPLDFEVAPEGRRQVLSTAPKSLQKLAKSRDAYFKEHWGFVQFCKDKVCGYVRFAPKCTGECTDVFPEYVERNYGVPDLDGTVKITSK